MSLTPMETIAFGCMLIFAVLVSVVAKYFGETLKREKQKDERLAEMIGELTKLFKHYRSLAENLPPPPFGTPRVAAPAHPFHDKKSSA